MSDKDFKELDTVVIQVRSVLNFMYTLGYTLDGTCKTGRFVTEVAELQGNRYISASNAVKLHNMGEANWTVYKNDQETVFVVAPNGIGFQVGFQPIAVKLAIASKLVKTAKFAVTQKGSLILKSGMVKPLNSSVLDMIEPS